MPVSDFARTDVPTAAPDTAVGDVVAAMRERDVSLVAVLDEHRPVGLLSAADVGRAYVQGEDLAARRAIDVAAEPVTVRASADLSTLVSTLEDEGVRRVTVVDGGGFVGVVTLDDALRQYGRDLTSVLDLLE